MFVCGVSKCIKQYIYVGKWSKCVANIFIVFHFGDGGICEMSELKAICRNVIFVATAKVNKNRETLLCQAIKIVKIIHNPVQIHTHRLEGRIRDSKLLVSVKILIEEYGRFEPYVAEHIDNDKLSFPAHGIVGMLWKPKRAFSRMFYLRMCHKNKE